MRYAVDLIHPYKPLALAMVRVEGHEKTYVRSSGPWGYGNPEGISKECGNRLHGFPCFPPAVIPMACFSGGDAGLNLGSLPSDWCFILPSREPKWPVIRPLSQ
jgi:hypothetical protein